MLSVEKSPPDPPCLVLKNSDGRRRRSTSTSTSCDDDNTPDLFNTHPTFSIRDYVYTARGQGRGRDNIKKNWPFSQQCLQLCLKHGVKNLLPPFEPPDSVVRSHCFTKGVGSQLNDKETTQEHDQNVYAESKLLKCESSKEIGKPLVVESTQAQSPLSEEQEKSSLPVQTSLCELENAICTQGQNLIHHAQPERESFPGDVLPCSAQEACDASSNLLGTSIEVDHLHPPCPSQKNETTVESSGKKCRLILKLGPISDPNRTEDATSNTAAVSDPMASKVCPVCKNFSSTSNTTLNAHIDQCLSVESTSKWTNNPTELTKHRAKPRKKIRSMVDICATAPRCTLEELDRRNGSNWATDSNLLNAESDVCVQGKRQRMSHVDMDDNGDESAVYFDSNGTKLRILSKFCDASRSSADEDSRLRKNMKNDKESKILSFDKKKPFGPKHSKHLKGKPRNKKLCYLDAVEVHGAQVHGAPEMNYEMEKSFEKEESLSHLLKNHDEINRNESGTLRQWVSSKRTGLMKRVNSKDGRRISRYPTSMKTNPLSENDKINLGNSSLEGSCILKTSNPSENVISSLKGKHVDRPFYEVQANDSGTNSLEVAESELNQLTSKDSSSPRGGCMLKLPRSPGTFASSPRSKRMEVHASGSLLKKAMNASESRKKISIKGTKFSTLGNGILVRSSLSNFKSKEIEVHPSAKKSSMHRSIAEMAAQVGAQSPNTKGQQDRVHDPTENVHESLNQIRGSDKSDGSSDSLISETEVTDQVSFGRSGVLKPRRKNHASSISGREVAVASETSLSGPMSCDLVQAYAGSHVKASLWQSQLGSKLTAKVDGIETAVEDVPFYEEISVNAMSNKDVARPSLKLSKTLGSEPHKSTSSSDSRHNSLQSIEVHERHSHGNVSTLSLAEQSQCGDQERHGKTEDNNTIGRYTSMASEVNSRVGEGISSSEGQYTRCGTEPTLFPAPPVSVLPSFADIGSDDLQETSSITSSKIMPSQDRHLMVDKELSGSPVSGTSIISNPTVARPDSKYPEPLSSLKHPEGQVKFFSGISGGSIESRMAGPTTLTFMLSANGAEKIDLDGESLRATGTPREGSMKFTNDQPCCCSRKESFSLGASLGYQDSQVLEQHSSSSVMPIKGKQITFTNVRPEIFISPSSCSVSRNSEAVVSGFESKSGVFSRKASPDTAQNFTNHGDFSPGHSSSQVHDVQSSSNPVLRLMGKNLMVVNKDENMQEQLRQPQVSQINFPSTGYTSHGFSAGNVSNQDHISFYHTASEDYTVFGQDSCHPPQPQYSGIDHSKGLRSLGNSKVRQTHPKQQAGNHKNMDMGGFKGSSLLQQGSNGRIDWPIPQKRSIRRSDSSFAYNVERVNPNREVIIIDDSPENEAEHGMINGKYTEGFGWSQPSPVGILPPSALCSNSRQMNSYTCHTSSNPFSQVESPVGSKPSYLVSYPGGTNTSPLKWGGTTEGLGVSMRSPFMSTSTPCNVSQAMYDSPHFP